MHDDRIISIVRKNYFTAFNRVESTLNEVGVSSSTIKVYNQETPSEIQRVYNKVKTTGYAQEQEFQMNPRLMMGG